MNIRSPNNIDVLLHCHTSSTEHPRIDALAVQEAIQMLLTLAAIERKEGNIFSTTPLGQAWVNALCAVEVPRKAFVDKNDNIVGYDK